MGVAGFGLSSTGTPKTNLSKLIYLNIPIQSCMCLKADILGILDTYKGCPYDAFSVLNNKDIKKFKYSQSGKCSK